MSPLHEWYEAILQDANIPHAHKDAPDIAAAQFLLLHAKDGHARLRDLNPTSLGRFLSQMGCVKLHRTNGNAWRFPPIDKARIIWEKYYRRWRWDLDAPEWVARS